MYILLYIYHIRFESNRASSYSFPPSFSPIIANYRFIYIRLFVSPRVSRARIDLTIRYQSVSNDFSLSLFIDKKRIIPDKVIVEQRGILCRLTGEYTSVFLCCMCIDTRECSFSTELSDLLTRHTRLGTRRRVRKISRRRQYVFSLNSTYLWVIETFARWRRNATADGRSSSRKITIIEHVLVTLLAWDTRPLFLSLSLSRTSRIGAIGSWFRVHPRRSSRAFRIFCSTSIEISAKFVRNARRRLSWFLGDIVTYFEYICLYRNLNSDEIDREILSLTYRSDIRNTFVFFVRKRKKKKEMLEIEKSMTHQSCFQTWTKHFDRTNSRTILPRITIYTDPPILPAFSETIKFE